MACSRLPLQCVRILALAVLAGLGGVAGAEIEIRGLRVEASYTSDNNVSRASAGDALKDGILGARVSAGLVVPVSARTRSLFQGFGGGERFHKYKGLSHNFVGGQAEFQFRPSGEFGAPTYSAFLRSTAEYYDSSLRDGYRHVYGVSALKPLTDRLQVSGALAGIVSDGKSTVFDNRSYSLRGNVDWSLGRWDTVYTGVEYRRGDVVSTGVGTLARTDTADAVVPDDAFGDTTLLAYRFKASTWIASLGYNRAFAEKHALDVSWRWAQSTPLHPSGYGSASEVRYVVNQLSLAYLMRF